jgi:hypothetical protein
MAERELKRLRDCLARDRKRLLSAARRAGAYIGFIDFIIGKLSAPARRFGARAAQNGQNVVKLRVISGGKSGRRFPR